MYIRNYNLEEWNGKFPKYDVTMQPSWCGAMGGTHGVGTSKRYQPHAGVGCPIAAAHTVSSRAKSWVQTLHVGQGTLQNRTAVN